MRAKLTSWDQRHPVQTQKQPRSDVKTNDNRNTMTYQIKKTYLNLLFFYYRWTTKILLTHCHHKPPTWKLHLSRGLKKQEKNILQGWENSHGSGKNPPKMFVSKTLSFRNARAIDNDNIKFESNYTTYGDKDLCCTTNNTL